MGDQITEILVPVDGSENSTRAALFGVDLAKAFGVGIRLFYIFPAASVEIIGMAGMSRSDIDQAAQAAAQKAFDATHQALANVSGVSIEQETSMGDPAEEVVRYTEDNPGAMVVIGRRGLSAMKSLLIGSVSDKVLRHARSPVMVIT